MTFFLSSKKVQTTTDCSPKQVERERRGGESDCLSSEKTEEAPVMEGSSEMKTASRSQAWFCTTGLASDVLVEVGDVIFHLHKFPLMYRSRRICELITDQEEEEKEAEGRGEGEIQEEEEEGVVEMRRISFPGFPGGSGAFEAAAKFCYGVKIEFTASNVVPIRCAAEYLQMTDDVSENNLVGRSERFFTNTVLRSVRYSVRALTSCDGDLLEMADELGITERCVDSIAAAQTFGSVERSALLVWPINDGAGGGGGGGTRGGRKKGASSRSSSTAAAAVLSDSWIEQLAALSLPVFKRVISAMKARDLSSDLIEGSLISYARRSIPGLSRSSRKKSSGSSVLSEQDQRELIETVITNLPVEKSSSSSTNTKFLFGLLRTVNILCASDSAREVLERKIGSQLEQSTLDDLLMPTYFYLVETLYDVDCVERLLLYFLDGLRQRDEVDGEDGDGRSALLAVGKIIDGYLSEIGSDVNLQPEKFCRLAFTLPDQARVFDDGLYRAIDVYLKAHPGISETERESVAGIMDCQKLTLEACTHAAQNERLPLRAVVQVLFFEQLQLRHAITGSFVTGEEQHGAEEEDGSGSRGGRGWGLGVRNSQVMRLDMDSMRNRMEELEKECSTMKKAIEKIDRTARGSGGVGRKSSLSKKIGCKFRTQVCDSQERNIIEITDGRNRRTEL